jgi:hypothetical protein
MAAQKIGFNGTPDRGAGTDGGVADTALPRISRRVQDTGVRLAPLALVSLVALVGPAAAGAHLRSGTVAVDYRATVATATKGFEAQVLAGDLAIRLAARPGHSVVVLGYLGEPLVRIDARGVAVNAASPSAVNDGLLRANRSVAGVALAWRITSRRRSVVWHDARLRGLPRGVHSAAWSVPLIVDGRHERIHGELVRVAPPSLSLWAVFALLCGFPAVLLRTRARRGAIAFALVAAGASTLTTAAFAFGAYANPGTWIIGFDALAFTGAGIGILLAGPDEWHTGAAAGIGLVSLVVGLAKADVFLHGVVLSSFPAFATRIVVALTLGTGIAATTLGAASYLATADVRERATATTAT